MEVLVTDAHTPAALAAIRELGRMGCHIVAMAERKTPALGLFSRYTAVQKLLPASLPESVYEEAVLDGLHELGQTFKRKPVLLACGLKTQSLAARHPDKFRLECLYLGPGAEAIAAGWDKRQLERTARALSIPMPEALAFNGAEDISELAKRIDYPAVVKYWGGEKMGLAPERRFFAVRGAAELATRYTRMYDVQSPVLLQRFIPGDSLCVAGVLDTDSRPIALFTYRRVRQDRGTGTLYESLPPGEVTRAAARLFTGLGMRGFAMAEFRGDRTNFTLLDVNTRLWRGFPLSCRCGAGLASAYVRAARGEMLPLSDGGEYASGLCMQDLPSDLAAALRRRYGPLGAALREVWRSAADPAVASMVRDREDRAVTKVWLKSLAGR